MSLYWQQAVQDRNATASEDRNHGKNKGLFKVFLVYLVSLSLKVCKAVFSDNTNTDTHWQNINLGQVQPNVWNNHASNQVLNLLTSYYKYFRTIHTTIIISNYINQRTTTMHINR